MKKEANKANKNTDVQLLELLKKVLPKATHDPQLAGQIYQAVERELQTKAKTASFEKFCHRCELPDLEPKSVNEVKRQLSEAFGEGADITLKPNKKEKNLAVEVAMPDGAQYNNVIAVKEVAPDDTGEQEISLKFVPFPVSLPGDKELVWALAKGETMTPAEAAVALTKVEEDFWGSKTGQKLIRDRVERCFPEFIARVPGKMLTEVGLKRHYKTPEPVKVLKPLPAH